MPNPDSSGAPATIDALLQETRRFPPPNDFAARRWCATQRSIERAQNDPEGFWAEAANRLDWFKRWDKVLEWNAPWAKWFVGGTAQRLLQLRRPAPPDLAAQQGRHHLGGRAGRHARAHLPGPVPRGQRLRRRAAGPGRARRATASPSTCR